MAMQPVTQNGAARPAPKGAILLVEGDAQVAEQMARALRSEHYRVDVLRKATEKPSSPIATYDAVIADVAGESGNGYDMLKAVHAVSPTTPVIFTSASADVESAMHSVSAGAYDYLPKPIDPALLRRKLGAAIARKKLASSEGTEGQPPSRARIVGTSPAMIDVYKTVAQVAPTTASVLVTGEAGTGKELVAREVHAHSKRAEGPFVVVNCAAIPEAVLESELFGHTRGAVQGATSDKRGAFEDAAGGTIFIEEIGDTSPRIQHALLRAITEGEIRRLGADKGIAVDVRVLASSSRDLKQEVERGRFRADLYQRLAVVAIHLPPLRERAQDVPALVHHFVNTHAARLGSAVPRVAPEVLTRLTAYTFPGNVRELSHLVERAMLAARDGVVTEHDLPPEVTGRAATHGSAALADDWPTLHVVSRRYIDRVLVFTGGNKTRAAEVLGIDRRTLNRMFARERLKKAQNKS